MTISFSQKRLCPFLLEPFENCYCVRMDSQDIERAVNLCNYNFEICEIYRKHGGNGSKRKHRNNSLTGSSEDNSEMAGYE